MFAQTARAFLPVEMRQREKQTRARSGNGERETTAQQTQRGDFAKREGEAFQGFAFGFLGRFDEGFGHLRDFPMRMMPQTHAQVSSSKTAPMSKKLRASLPAETPK